ncbi:Putative uncharacterized protein [Taphrina deformans PYCC 5710]|uniref:Phosphatidate phosphatase APP1 catalytic domain-containing protein n=1 Tax=Taphrina deformans (strain PYCC 5710 / ATCC 11124 / CBS 356.35 / IMI 108563 / JCM 9778 / NBRC 8474) TaxID=1097556 RepID=R4X924_TAPDE|nr:Putative uncharacterized protein [Taphrina deformans PYCC 5710]|eukprot:CCG82179.1 Putative uncharacterized protein [Taphrina deformans PYCC 5710]
MNDADMINQSGYRRALRYLRTSISQSSLNSRLSTASNDKDLEAVNRYSSNALELVFFPSYASRTRRSETEYNVNIHGWLFTPVPAGKQTRRNRYTMLLARSLAGLPAIPDSATSEGSTNSLAADHGGLDADFEEKIASENGRAEIQIADPNMPNHHDNSEFSDTSAPSTPGAYVSRAASFPFTSSLSDGASRLSRASSMKRQDSNDSQTQKFTRHYSDHDLVNCHANLTTRISPFLAKAAPERVLKCDIFADGERISSTKLMTSENGHFRGTIKIPQSEKDMSKVNRLEARIDENDVSGSTEIHFVGEAGVSVISDVDDTVKHTNILAGMREAFRNAFVRDLPTLTITGVRQWYESMKAMGCNIHYVSNAPYQLWPCLASFIKIAGLPAGSIHLKQYSGFLQGMFEPAAEKKRANVERILVDFPSRKFILIGDSGEQDLELYTELARSAYAKQILGIFIRDVSSIKSAVATPTGESGEDFFSAGQGDNTVDNGTGTHSLEPVAEVVSPAPRLPERKTQALVDLDSSDVPAAKDIKSADSNKSHWADMIDLGLPSISSAIKLAPEALKAIDTVPPKSTTAQSTTDPRAGRPTLPRKPTALRFWSKGEENQEKSNVQSVKPTSRPSLSRTSSASSFQNGIQESVIGSRRPALLRSMSGNSSYYGEGRRLTKAQERTQAWELRLAKARSSLPPQIKIYTWREGSDCQARAEELIRRALKQ